MTTILDIHERTRLGTESVRRATAGRTRQAVLALGAGVVTGLVMGIATAVAGRWS